VDIFALMIDSLIEFWVLILELYLNIIVLPSLLHTFCFSHSRGRSVGRKMANEFEFQFNDCFGAGKVLEAFMKLFPINSGYLFLRSIAYFEVDFPESLSSLIPPESIQN
jgi:hypothetical protein